MRAHHRITQSQMAEFLEESQQYISRLLLDQINPRLNRLQKFAQKTDTDIAFWLIATGPEKEKAIKKAYKAKCRSDSRGEAA